MPAHVCRAATELIGRSAARLLFFFFGGGGWGGGIDALKPSRRCPAGQRVRRSARALEIAPARCRGDSRGGIADAAF